MKIALFEVREDEQIILDKIMKEYLKNEQIDEIQVYTETFSEKYIGKLEGVEGISTLSGTRFDSKMLDGMKAAGILYLSLRCIGVNHIDVEYAKKIGVQVKAASYPPNAVADFTVLLILLALRKYKPALWRQQVNDYSLSGLQGRNLENMTVGIIGAGSIGKKVLQNLTGFGCKLLAYSRHEEESVCEYAEYVSLDTLYHECDIISLHIPLTKQTENMIDAKALKKMKDGVILVNPSRGEIMNIQDMIEGIESSKIGALAMDVFENDLTIYHKNRTLDIIQNREMAYLRQFPNTILTQHMAFYTYESVESMVKCGIDGIIEMCKFAKK